MEEVLDLIRPFETSGPPQGQAANPDQILLTRSPTGTGGEQRILYRSQLSSGIINVEYVRQWVLPLLAARLDGRSRFDLVQNVQVGDLLEPQHSHLGRLFQNSDLRERVRGIIEAAFDRYLVIDPTSVGQLRARLSRRPPADASEEQSWDERARSFHSQAELLHEESDGLQAFTGLVSAVVSLPHRILLIDEPEAFLHPPLARRLGRELAALAHERRTSLFAATHSADFLMGCIESSIDTTIVRVTYERQVATARWLSPEDVGSFMQDPILRSTRALSGLFHRAVVVTEADADRAFYDEVNQRLVAADRGLDDTLFTGAQNWQTVGRVIGPLRQLGIPALAIIDLDVIASPDSWTSYWDSLNLHPDEKARLGQQRAECRALLEALGADKPYKTQGLQALDADDRAQVANFLDELEGYGVFVVRVGELERWLEHLGVRGAKSQWIVRIFQAMGDDASSAGYVQPATDDVWAFLDRAACWVDDQDRRGM